MTSSDDEPEIVTSPLSQRLTRDGLTVQVEIFGDGEGRWILEVIDGQDTSHVWEHHFDTDAQALAEAVRALEEEPAEFRSGPDDTRTLH